MDNKCILYSVSKDACCIHKNASDTNSWTFMNSADSREILKEILSEADYTEVINTWGDSYSVPEPAPLSLNELTKLRESVIEKMSAACHETIVAGFDAPLSDGKTYHFSLQLEDQLMIQALMLKVKSGETTLLPYHADGETCRYFSPEEIITIYNKMEHIVTYNTTYFNSLRDYINSLEKSSKLHNIRYGVEIPSQYQSEVLATMI